MKCGLLIFVTVVLYSLTQTPVSAMSGCKKVIEDGIRQYWKEHGGVPKMKDSGLMRFAYTTKDVRPDTVTCVLASHDYTTHIAPATFYYKNGTKNHVEFKFTTGEGVIHQTLGNEEFLEYMILDQCGVIAFYKCIPNGPATGTDAAIIAVSVSAEGKPETQKQIITALSQLIGLGISDLQQLGTCPENIKN